MSESDTAKTILLLMERMKKLTTRMEAPITISIKPMYLQNCFIFENVLVAVL